MLLEGMLANEIVEYYIVVESSSLASGGIPVCTGIFIMPTSYQTWVWIKEAHIDWSMVTCLVSTRLELP